MVPAHQPVVDTLDRLLRAAGCEPTVTRTSRPDATRADREAKGRELAVALELAAQFPLRRPERWPRPTLA